MNAEDADCLKGRDLHEICFGKGTGYQKKLKTETHKRKGYLLHSSVSFHSKDCFAAIVMFKISFIQPLMSSICRSMREWSLTFNIILYNKDDTFGILGL